MTALRRPAVLLPLLFALSVAAHVGLELALAGRLGPPLDDGWIYMAFARSFANGEGITYPGHDGTVCAITGPVWCFTLAGAFAVFGASVLVTKLVGVLVGMLGVLAVRRLGVAATGDPLLGTVAAALVALSPRLAWGSLSGMEVPWFVATTALGFALHLERRHDGFWRHLPALVVLALAGYARPECLVLPFVAALDRLRLGVVPLVLAGLASVALVAVFPAYHWLVSGHPLPTTFYAKAAADSPLAILRHDGATAALSAWVSNVGAQLAATLGYLPSQVPWLAPGLLVGLVVGWRQKNGVPFLAGAVLLFVLARGSLGFQPPWFQDGRYFVHLMPLAVIAGLAGFDLRRAAIVPQAAVAAALVAWFVLTPELAMVLSFDRIPVTLDVGTDTARLGLVTLPAAGVAGLALLGLAFGRARPLGRPPLWIVVPWLAVVLGFGAVRYGQGVRDTYDLNVAMAERVADEVPPGELVACHDIGALGWFADRPMLDLAGLGSPEVAFAPRAPGGRPDLTAILLRHRPRYLCLTSDMMGVVNPAAAPPPGLVRVVPVGAPIRSEVNVTVLGGDYFLLELVWD